VSFDTLSSKVEKIFLLDFGSALNESLLDDLRDFVNIAMTNKSDIFTNSDSLLKLHPHFNKFEFRHFSTLT
jgi:hypothetical protein